MASTRHLGMILMSSLGLASMGCSDDGVSASDSAATESGTGETETETDDPATASDSDETGTATMGGDGDGDTTGDGDGDMTGDGDGDTSGDGDGDTSGDGDGDTSGDGDGDTSGDGDGDTSGDGDGDATGDGDGDTTGDGDGDTTGDGDGDDPNMYAPWILSVDEPDQTTDRLIQIIVDGNDFGQVNVICEDIELPDTIPSNTAFTSLTFNSTVLYASVRKNNVNGDTLLRIDPCTCTSTEIGQYGGGMFDGLNGITSNAVQTMFGASSTDDIIIDIEPGDASAVQIAQLPGDWGSTGLTWSDPVDNVLYGINASIDRLYTFNGDDASELASVQLDGNFSSVGIEYHPGFDVLYACGIAGNQRSLYSVDIESGAVSLEAADLWAATCDNLAAPFGPVECIPQ